MIPEEESRPATLFHIEHIIPETRFAKGDPKRNDPANLALACPRCNQYKSDDTHEPDPQTGVLTPLFHPRTDDWSEHFLARPSGHIVGLGPKGRATVQALRFNDGDRVRGRLLYYRRGIWPGLSE